MAVVVQCYHCDTILELDEGFRGGVCRCSTCGSLLQVPKASGAAAGKARPAAPGASPTSVARPSSPTEDPGLSRGQFDPKNRSGARPATPDIGGSSSGLRQGRTAAPTATKIEKVKPLSGPTQAIPHAKETKKNTTLLFVAIGGGALLLVIAVIVVVAIVIAVGKETPASNGNGSSGGIPASGGSSSGGIPPKPPETKGPNFLGIPLVGKQIVLSIDSASSMQDSFDFVRRGVSHALDSLGSDQKLLVVVWTDSAVVRVPDTGFVSKSEARALKEALDNIPVRGSTNAEANMTNTLTVGGDQIIFVTAKFGLSESLAQPVLDAAKSGQRLDAIKITSEDSPSPLVEIAKKTNGQFLFLTQSQLEQASNK